MPGIAITDFESEFTAFLKNAGPATLSISTLNSFIEDTRGSLDSSETRQQAFAKLDLLKIAQNLDITDNKIIRKLAILKLESIFSLEKTNINLNALSNLYISYPKAVGDAKPFCVAARMGRYEWFESLKAIGLGINKKENGHELLKALLEGAKIASQSSRKKTDLAQRFERGAKELIKLGANFEPLDDFSEDDQILLLRCKIELLFTHQDQQKATHEFGSLYKKYKTQVDQALPLHIAARMGQYNWFRFLNALGFNINELDKEKKAPLILFLETAKKQANTLTDKIQHFHMGIITLTALKADLRLCEEKDRVNIQKICKSFYKKALFSKETRDFLTGDKKMSIISQEIMDTAKETLGKSTYVTWKQKYYNPSKEELVTKETERSKKNILTAPVETTALAPVEPKRAEQQPIFTPRIQFSALLPATDQKPKKPSITDRYLDPINTRKIQEEQTAVQKGGQPAPKTEEQKKAFADLQNLFNKPNQPILPTKQTPNLKTSTYRSATTGLGLNGRKTGDNGRPFKGL